MKFHHLVGWSSAICIALAACVGDEPSSSSDNDGGTDGSVGDSANGSDASSGDSGADAGPFTPTSLGGALRLWYESSPENVELSDAGDGTVVSWKDKSPSALDALPTFKATRGPLYRPAEAGAPPFIDFNSQDCMLGRDTEQKNLEFANREFVVSAVVLLAQAPAPDIDLPVFDRIESTLGHDGLLTFEVAGDGTVVATVKGDGSDAGASLTSQNPVLSDLVPHVISLRRIRQASLPTDVLQIRIDGVPEQTNVPQIDLTLGVASFNFGSFPYVAGPFLIFDLDVAEMVVVSPSDTSAISDATVGEVEGYLQAKYGTPKH